jgi:exosortase family protein XrtF
MDVLKQNKAAIYFLLVFVALYLILNTIYGFFVEAYLPNPDPITISVSKQVVFALSWWDESVAYHVKEGTKNVGVSNNYRHVLNVFEGCNGLNVMIVFISFLIAYKGKIRMTFVFGLVGLVIIHVINLGRVALLYAVEIYLPRYLYFFHKYLFTGIIYAVVFFMWYVWAKSVKRETGR